MKETTKSTVKSATKSTAKKVQTSEQKNISNDITKHFQEVAQKNELKASADDKRLYKRFISIIDKEYKKMENCYLNTAFSLHAIYTKKLYKIDGYQNIYELAKDKFSISRGTCNGFINICDKFGVPNENGTIVDLQESFKPYSVSQLMVMLNMNQELLNKTDPSMSVRSIKEMKRDYLDSLEAKQFEMSDNTNLSDFSMNDPEDSVMKRNDNLDISSTDHKLFVCSVNSYDELVKLQGVIEDTLKDVRKSRKKSDIRLELNIVF